MEPEKEIVVKSKLIYTNKQEMHMSTIRNSLCICAVNVNLPSHGTIVNRISNFFHTIDIFEIMSISL